MTTQSSCSSTCSGTRAIIMARSNWPSNWRAARSPIRKPGRSHGASGCARSKPPWRGCRTLRSSPDFRILLASDTISRRDREPNQAYAERRARIAAQTDSPVVLWGFTGREEISQAYIFAQEDNFYYLTGHNEEEAGLIILPALKAGQARDSWDGPREILFLPAKDTGKEKWNGVRMSPTDPDISARTGFASVQAFGQMRAVVETLTKVYPNF